MLQNLGNHNGGKGKTNAIQGFKDVATAHCHHISDGKAVTPKGWGH